MAIGIKLNQGMFGRTRDGRVFGPMEHSRINGDYRFRAMQIDDDRMETWTSDGRASLNGPTARDIIEIVNRNGIDISDALSQAVYVKSAPKAGRPPAIPTPLYLTPPEKAFIESLIAEGMAQSADAGQAKPDARQDNLLLLFIDLLNPAELADIISRKFSPSLPLNLRGPKGQIMFHAAARAIIEVLKLKALKNESENKLRHFENPKGGQNDSPVAAYKCGVCGTGDKTAYMQCNHPACPDGRDR